MRKNIMYVVCPIMIGISVATMITFNRSLFDLSNLFSPEVEFVIRVASAICALLSILFILPCARLFYMRFIWNASDQSSSCSMVVVSDQPPPYSSVVASDQSCQSDDIQEKDSCVVVVDTVTNVSIYRKDIEVYL